MSLRVPARTSLATRVTEKFAELRAERLSFLRTPQRRHTAEGDRRIHGMSAHDFMYCFENLGDNCEFGLVQRRCGAEPLGLLRFSTTPQDILLACALRARLDDLLDRKDLDLQVTADGYYLCNRKYDIGFGHHGIDECDLPPEQAFSVLLRRLQFLLRKLRDVLKTGEKIFVYRSRYSSDPDRVLSLGDALRGFGPTLLLWVSSATEPETIGTVEPLAEHVLRGWIEPESNNRTLALDTWMKLCDQAYTLWPLRNHASAGGGLGTATW
jgi:hypothetical protein